jgi:hypothetical protein
MMFLTCESEEGGMSNHLGNKPIVSCSSVEDQNKIKEWAKTARVNDVCYWGCGFIIAVPDAIATNLKRDVIPYMISFICF